MSGEQDVEQYKDWVVEGMEMLYGKGFLSPGGAPEVDSFEANATIGCGGVAVRPSDLIVADDDGVVVVARQIAAEVIDWVEEHEQAEEYVKGLIEKEGVAPGKYYPISEETVIRSRESTGSR